MKSNQPRLRILMQKYLRSVGIDPNGMTYGPLKRAVLDHIGWADKEFSKPELRARISTSKPRTSGPAAALGFYDTEEWRRLRYRALKLHGGRCQCCGAHPKPGNPLHVDHVKPRSRFPELELELSNLQVLCADCNLGKGAWDQTDWRPEATA